jgi:hypothetical protein
MHDVLVKMASELPTHDVVKPTEEVIFEMVDQMKKKYNSPRGLVAMELALLDLAGWPAGSLVFLPGPVDSAADGFQLSSSPGFRKLMDAQMTTHKQLLIARKEF